MIWHCPHCRREWTTADDQTALFHPCSASPRRRSIVGAKTREERVTEMFAALTEAVGEDAMLRGGE